MVSRYHARCMAEAQMSNLKQSRYNAKRAEATALKALYEAQLEYVSAMNAANEKRAAMRKAARLIRERRIQHDALKAVDE